MSTLTRPSRQRRMAGAPGVNGVVAAPSVRSIAITPPNASTGQDTLRAVARPCSSTAPLAGIRTICSVPVRIALPAPPNESRFHCQPCVAVTCPGPGSASAPSGVGRVIISWSAGIVAWFSTVTVILAVSPTPTGSGDMLNPIVGLGRGGLVVGATAAGFGATGSAALFEGGGKHLRQQGNAAQHRDGEGAAGQ